MKEFYNMIVFNFLTLFHEAHYNGYTYLFDETRLFRKNETAQSIMMLLQPANSVGSLITYP